jgi:hypothetical protein
MWDNAVRNGYVQNGVPSLLSQYNDHKPDELTMTHRDARNDHIAATPSYRMDEGSYGSSDSSSTAQTSSCSLSNYLLLALALMFAWYLYTE